MSGHSRGSPPASTPLRWAANSPGIASSWMLAGRHRAPRTFSPRIAVYWNLGRRMTVTGVHQLWVADIAIRLLAALQAALARRQPPPGVVIILTWACHTPAAIILKMAVEAHLAGHFLQPQVFAAMAVVTHWVNCAAVEKPGDSLT